MCMCYDKLRKGIPQILINLLKINQHRKMKSGYIDSRINNMQGLFVLFASVGSSDPVRVLRLLQNKYTGYN